jgi:hypothetical protein
MSLNALALFLAAASSIEAAELAPNMPIASVPLELHDDIPFLEVRINDAGPFWFNVDSGAGACVIDKSVASRLKIRSEGELQGTGAGAGTFPYSVAANVHFTTGQLSFTAEKTRVIDLSGVPTPKDRKLGGLFGYDFLQRYVVALDYEKSVMTVYDPRSFVYRGPGAALPITFRKNVPFVRGKIQVPGQSPAEHEWLVDTGSADALNDEVIAASTGERNKLTGGRGLGKQFEILQAKADQVELGPFHFRDVLGFSGGMKIGGGLLKHFTVIFDYSSERMILQPNQRYRE